MGDPSSEEWVGTILKTDGRRRIDDAAPDNFTFWQDYGLAMAAEKVLLIGEYDWTGSNGGLTLSTFYNQVIKTNSVGDIAWNVMSHDDQCCNYITHDDGYSIYYPNGNASILQKRLLRLVQHWYQYVSMTHLPSNPLNATTLTDIP